MKTIKKQTAVEWLVNKLNNDFENNDFLINYANEISQAKEMEKKQIIDATLYGFREDAEAFDWKGDNCNAEEYYNETFKNK